METQSELQQWQEELLAMDEFKRTLENYCEIPLKEKQKEMIEKLLYPTDSNPFHLEVRYKRILERALTWGYYKEEDREALNYARECYLKGRNWIK